MQFAEENRTILLAEYENKSTYELAKELGTYPNKVNRALKRFNATDHRSDVKTGTVACHAQHPGYPYKQRRREKFPHGDRESFGPFAGDNAKRLLGSSGAPAPVMDG